MKKSCPYCTIPEIKERTIASSKYSWSFPTNIPIVPGHILVVPKRCVATYEKMTEAERKDLFSLVTRIKKSLKKTFKTEGFNIAWNEGGVAGQSVPHFHLHLLPRKSGDAGITEYEPRKFLYRPGSREKTPEKELQAVAKLIKKNL
jgi:diadenosine tetraphosphate (Ap4A) HIT family hydrolase